VSQSPDRDAYVRQLLAAYRRLPDSLGRTRPADRRLAADLHRRRVPLATVEAALLLAIARRRARPPGADPLQPIRSLHYFLPIIEELLHQPLPEGYLELLRARLANDPAHPAPVQKTTFLHER
jgi:hypothetical protein